MFKKLKDKLTEEMKSSPQRLQSIAQAAQAVVTSASSSISDISNHDLFTIADDGADTPKKAIDNKTNSPAGFQEVSLSQSPSPFHIMAPNETQEKTDKVAPLANNHYANNAYQSENSIEPPSNVGSYFTPSSTRVRKLSNSSTASDVSFRLPNYETPGNMFHLQSDLDVSASEMEDNVSVPAQLERVSKEHLYAAYRRTNEKYNKYRGRYTDLARHYRNLERENAKAKAVLVETQDKALRRISELREQCQLEQSAKAHLENALRLELDEKNMKIDSLFTKINLLQSYSSNDKFTPAAEESNESVAAPEDNSNPPLIDLTDSTQPEETELQKITVELKNANNKIQKLEQLVNKCKETIKTHKDKSSQVHSELQIVSSQLDKVTTENNQLKLDLGERDNLAKRLEESSKIVKTLEEQVKSFEQQRLDLEHRLNVSSDKISALNNEINILSKREEENMISLAENKLSIHKELETKEMEIKSLNESMSKYESDLKSNETVIKNLKDKIKTNEQDIGTLKKNIAELEDDKKKISITEDKNKGHELRVQELEAKCNSIAENLKCTEFQLNQEVAEKLATIDRNNFLEDRNKQLVDDISGKSKRLTDLENDLSAMREQTENNVSAVEYQSIKEQCDKLSESILSLEKDLDDKNNVINELNADLQSFKVDNERLITDNESISHKLNELLEEKHNLDKCRGDLSEEFNLLKKTYEDEGQRLKTQIEKLENDITSANLAFADEKKSLEGRTVDAEHELEASRTKIKQFENQLAEFNNLKDKYDSLKIKFVEKTQDNEKTSSEFVIEKQTLEKACESVNTENSSLKQKCATLEESNDRLEKQVNVYETENKEMKSKTSEMIENINSLQNELSVLQASHVQMLAEKNSIEEKITQIEQLKTDNDEHEINSKMAEIDKLNGTLKQLQIDNESLSADKCSLEKSVDDLSIKLKDYEDKLQEYAANNEVWQQKLSNILNDNNNLQEKCGKLKYEKDSCTERIATLELKCNEFDVLRNQIEESKLEKEFLNMRVSQLETDIKQANTENNKLSSENAGLQNELSASTNNNKTRIDNLSRQLETMKESEKMLKEELGALTKEKNDACEKLQRLSADNENLNSKLNNYSDDAEKMESLEAEKNQLESKLSTINSDLESIKRDKDQQIDQLKSEFSNVNELFQRKIVEFDELSRKHGEIKSEIESLNVKIRVLNKIEAEHVSTLETVQTLKDENVKLVSDNEGLQAHLTKVSKENSELNDKIRKMVANDEVCSVTNKKELEASPHNGIDLHSELNKLKEENSQISEKLKLYDDLNNKMLDLERQNSILIEEKLELEDQIKSSMDQHNHFSTSNADVTALLDQIKAINEEKSQLANQLANLDVLHKSNNNNIQMLEQKNQKLGLTNEKLERRLDEALVSLNHIRSMEENTEIEYLRNILYEYLTGPTNNNLILAKVLAAVAKFDHRQTQLVLEREKEKQGLLGQLGLL